MNYSLRILALILFCTSIVIAQVTLEKTPDEKGEKLQKEAVLFLRETLTDVNGMRSLENRISFTAELAGLMWFHDEREARSMYGGVITDFKDLVTKYDAQMNDIGATLADHRRGGFMSFGGAEPTDRSMVVKRFMTAMGVRQQITMSIAEHDPELALTFYNDSLSAISNPEFRKEVENRDSNFETQLLSQIAAGNPAKAVQLGTASLKRGVTYQHVEVLKKIHAKDPEKGVEFAAAMLSKLKSDRLSSSGLYVVEHLVNFAEQTIDASKKRGGKRPIYTVGEIRDLVELLAQVVLSRGDDEYVGAGYLEMIQRYSPGRAAQIRAKFKSSGGSARVYGSNAKGRAYAVANAMNAAGNAAYYGDPNSSSNTDSAASEQELLKGVQSLTTRELPKEERERIIMQARKIVLQTPGRDKKVAGLSMLATQVSKMGDKALATEIMRDAESLVNPAPKNYQDFMLTWMLASGYANADPDKAFPLLEETIGRANETLEAFVKVGEFVDVAEEMIQDGEVQVGAFGGQMISGLTRELGMADATIQVLAKADFGKTKALTNRFDRAEIRILAKMMVLRAVLDPRKGAKPDVQVDMDVDY